MATVKDVAKLAGVSTATVSNVFTGKRRVNPALKAAVLKAAQELDYRPNAVAKSLRSRRTSTIGVAVPDITNPFFNEIIAGIEAHASQQGYQVILVSSNEDTACEVERVRALVDRRVDGLIIVPTRDGLPCAELLARKRLSVVMVDRGQPDAPADLITVDNEAAAYEGTCHLIALGHRRIGFLASTLDLGNIRERVAGFHRALHEYGLTDLYGIRSGKTIPGSEATARALLQETPRPTALFCATNTMTLGAIRALRSLNLAIPDEVSLLSFDEFAWMTLVQPPLTTIKQPTADLAAQAWRLLMRRLAGDTSAPQHLRLSCTLEVRHSTAPPAQHAMEVV